MPKAKTEYTIRVGTPQWSACAVVSGTWDDVMAYLHRTVREMEDQHGIIDELAIASVAWGTRTHSFFVMSSPPLVDSAILQSRKEAMHGNQKNTPQGRGTDQERQATHARTTQSSGNT
jgi:hypothetical protein